MHNKGSPNSYNTSVSGKVYALLEDRPEGVSTQTLSEWTNLSVGTVRKSLKRLESKLIVERVMRADQFVWRLTR